MSQVRVFINTFDLLGNYSGFQEVTNDVDKNSIGTVRQRLDNSAYEVGVFKNTNLNLKLRNDHGKYSDPGVLQSIFVKKRIDSIVKVTWFANDDLPICGSAICGEAMLGDELNVFYGMLNDVASKQDIRDQKIKFSCQGMESLLDRVETNYGSLSGSDVVSDIIYDLLNQSAITALMTVDAGNISVGVDQIPDDITSLEGTTVKGALNKLLEISNSVMYVDVADQTVYVKPRTPGATLDYTFYGQASSIGSENIVDIKNVRTGLNKTFNYWVWKDTNIVSRDIQSVNDNGVRRREVDSKLFTGTTKRTNVLDNFRDEFKDPKQELELTGILDYDTIQLFLLDKVNIDYPTVFEPAQGSELPIYGTATYGEDKYPLGQWNLTIDTSTEWKVLGRSVDLKKGLIKYDLREI